MLDEDSSILGGMSVGLLQGQLLHVGQGCLVVALHLHHDSQVQVVLPVLAGQGQGVPANTVYLRANPILDTRISVRPFVRLSFVTLRGPPLYSETGWTGELWSNPFLLIFEN